MIVFVLGQAGAGSLQVIENFYSRNKLMDPASSPEQKELKLVTLSRITIEGAIMAVYDDAATKRPVDYAEVHNASGDLLAIFWFDKFGILRTLIDRSIIEKKDKVAGDLLLVLDGDAV
jgi:hypothetical protein